MRSLLVLILIIFAILSPNLCYSQSGIPYINYIQTREGYETENWSLCQLEDGAMLFANRKGIIKYDGNEWKPISIQGVPIIIKQNPNNKIVYLISDRNYGFLKKNDFGSYEYHIIADSIQLSESSSEIEFRDSTIIFYDQDNLFLHKISDGSLFSQYHSSSYGNFAGLINTPDALYMNIEQKGLFRLSVDTMISSGISNFQNDRLLFSLAQENQKVLIGTESGKLFELMGTSISEFTLSNEEYLIENVLSGGLILNDSSYVFSTLYGGVLIVNKKDGKIFYTLNYETGIPDDEIYAMGTDDNNGLWLSYEFGLCRVDPSLPIKDYSNYPGLEGLITNSAWYNGELYVSTTEGLYYLSEVKNYEDVEIYLKREIQAESNTEKRKIRRILKKNEDENKKGLIGRIFKRNRNEENESKPIFSKKEPTPPSTKTEYVKKKISKLKSIDFVYAKTEGLNSRCQQLKVTPNGLLVGSSSGLYVVENYKAQLVFDTRNIHFIGGENEDLSTIICSDNGAFSLKHTEKGWKVIEEVILTEEPVFSALEMDNSQWISGFDIVYHLQNDSTGSSSLKTYRFKSVYPEELYLASSQDTLFLFSNSAIRYYSSELDSFIIYQQIGFRPEDFTSLVYFPADNGEIWLSIDKRLFEFNGASTEDSSKVNIWGLFNSINSYSPDTKRGSWIIDDYNTIFWIDPGKNYKPEIYFSIRIENISNEQGENFKAGSLSLDSNEKLLRISVSAPIFLKDKSTLYNFLIEGKMENWSKWSSNSVLEFYPEPGEYKIRIQAKNILDELSEPITILFEVKPPFYQRTWFYLLLIPIILGIFYIVLLLRERKLKNDKRILEEKVQVRTEEIRQQKQMIEAQKDDITSSITYASRIQNAILPAKAIFEKSFSEYFIFYKPRDIVSGDFYYINEINDLVVFAAADCTGHGVPGAFMSMLGNSFLNEICSDPKASLKSGDILISLRDKITGALSQSGENIEARDGMDIALCVFNKKKKTIEYSGAYNPLYLVRGEQFIEYKADRMPIGYYPEKKKFKTQAIKVQSKDVLYLFSDGFPDQFGGPNGKKFTAKRFRQILISQAAYPISKQEDFLQKQLEEWQTASEQIDDILVLGVRI